MSEERMSELDREVIRVANKERKGEPIAAPAGKYVDVKSVQKSHVARCTAIKVLICILVAALFVATLVDPGFVKYMAIVGVLVCGMVAAVTVDRFVRGR